MYGTVKGREMHLREQGDDESLKHHPQSPGRLLEAESSGKDDRMEYCPVLHPLEAGSQLQLHILQHQFCYDAELLPETPNQT